MPQTHCLWLLVHPQLLCVPSNYRNHCQADLAPGLFSVLLWSKLLADMLAVCPGSRGRQRKGPSGKQKQKAKSDAQKNKPPAIYDAAADDGPTPEELRRREMRSGRFARGASDQSGRANVPVYAVRLLWLCWSKQRLHCRDYVRLSSSRFCSLYCCSSEKCQFRGRQ